MSNALINESSPYLLQHAENPVNWLPWGDRAFQLAKEQNKMIFLSVGYSTCHWCHVMERESFESVQVAQVLNEHFISIKVDREERPDVDATYMAFVQALTGSGGWPMNVWLTPEGKPVVGGTYFPPENGNGRMGFLQVCQEVGGMWRDEPEKFLEEGENVLDVLQSRADSFKETNLNFESVRSAVIADFQHSYDCDFGGFGGAPKFPRPMWLELLSYLTWSEESDVHGAYCKTMLLTTLEGMQRGGINDQLGGGFHRYSVDTQWHIPHFEKMLYDQGQLLKLYTHAWLLTKQEVYRDTATAIKNYVLRDLSCSCGAFHAGEDADSLDSSGVKREGEYWTWSKEDLTKALDDSELEEFASFVYGIKPNGNAARESDPHGEFEGRNTLWLVAGEKESCERFSLSKEQYVSRMVLVRERMLDYRSDKKLPHRDDKIVLAWNAYVIDSLFSFSRVFQCEESYEAAVTALQFIRQNMWRKGQLLRTWRDGKGSVAGFAQDYVALIQALQNAYQADGKEEWLVWAREAQSILDKQFWDRSRGGYTLSSSVGGKELVVMVEDFDGPEPSTNSLAALNLSKWKVLGGGANDTEKLYAMELRTSQAMVENPQAVPGFILNSLISQRGWCKVSCSLKSAMKLFQTYLPHVIFDYSEEVDGYRICRGETCYPHVQDWKEALKLLV